MHLSDLDEEIRVSNPGATLLPEIEVSSQEAVAMFQHDCKIVE